MSVINKLSEIRILLFLKMIPDMVSEYWRFAGHTVRCNMSKTPEKLLTEILMLTHALEKGLSIHVKKKGFGIQKLMQLKSYICRYIEKYGYTEQLNTPISMVLELVEYHQTDGVKDERLNRVEADILAVLSNIDKKKSDFEQAGYVVRTKPEMLSLQTVPFEQLAMSRYSFRHFADTQITVDELTHVFDIAKKSPSACNRQSYRVHVYSGELKDRILKLQGGASSFYKEADKAILITGNLNRYYTMEAHLPYVDASLFGMSLIYAMTANGIASIPLTMGRKRDILNAIYKEMDIPKNEVPVLLIAAGHYPDKAELSRSERNPVEYFATFH